MRSLRLGQSLREVLRHRRFTHLICQSLMLILCRPSRGLFELSSDIAERLMVVEITQIDLQEFQVVDPRFCGRWLHSLGVSASPGYFDLTAEAVRLSKLCAVAFFYPAQVLSGSTCHRILCKTSPHTKTL